GVDAFDPDDAVLLHERLQVLVGAMVRRHTAELAHDEAARVRLVRFHVVDADPVVADVGVGHGDDLAVVTGIGEDLLVARHGGVEHDLADGATGRAEAVPVVDGPVLEGEHRGGFAKERHASSDCSTSWRAYWFLEGDVDASRTRTRDAYRDGQRARSDPRLGARARTRRGHRRP